MIIYFFKRSNFSYCVFLWAISLCVLKKQRNIEWMTKAFFALVVYTSVIWKQFLDSYFEKTSTCFTLFFNTSTHFMKTAIKRHKERDHMTYFHWFLFGGLYQNKKQFFYQLVWHHNKFKSWRDKNNSRMNNFCCADKN